MHEAAVAYFAQYVDDFAVFQAQLVLVRGLKSKGDLTVLFS